MLAFLEPEVDFCWSAVIAPPDSKSSHLLGLAWEPRVWGMWNDTVFPPHSSPLLSGYAGSSSESLSRSSNVPPGLERLYGDGFFLPSLDSGSLQLRNISPPLVPLTVTTSGLSSSPVNYIPVNRADLMAIAATNSAMLNSTPSQSNTMAPSRKRRIIIDPDGKKAIAVKETNRKKITNLEQLHLPSSADPSSGHKQPMKAPMRRSQKLGDKITALQQLVSPFGKTDTASVLDEASIYIKSLHEHIGVLTAPYFQSRSLPYQQDIGEVSASLHEMGLCVAPISSPIVEIASRASYEHRPAVRKPWSFGGALS